MHSAILMGTKNGPPFVDGVLVSWCFTSMSSSVPSPLVDTNPASAKAARRGQCRATPAVQA